MLARLHALHACTLLSSISMQRSMQCATRYAVCIAAYCVMHFASLTRLSRVLTLATSRLLAASHCVCVACRRPWSRPWRLCCCCVVCSGSGSGVRVASSVVGKSWTCTVVALRLLQFVNSEVTTSAGMSCARIVTGVTRALLCTSLAQRFFATLLPFTGA